MKAISAVFPLCLVLLFGVSGLNAQSPDAQAIIRKTDEKARGNTSQATITIQTVRPSWSRDLQMKLWSKGTRYAMILITDPVKEKGTVFLKNQKEVWNWVPSIERVIKLPPSMMTQSWMGTDFTNDDLVKESSMVDDYVQSLSGEEKLRDRDCYIIQLIPKPDAAVVWGKILTWIDKKEYIQLKTEFYDEDGELVNTMNGYDVKMIGGRVLPTRMEMVPEDDPGHKTIMTYSVLEFDQPIDDSFFSTLNMKKVK